MLGGCASKYTEDNYLQDKSAEEIFAMGKKEMDEKNYSEAIKVFEMLEKLHPYSKLTAEAQLYSGDCSYASKKYTEADAAYEIFVRTHPTHKKVPYAIYMIGLLNFEQMPIIERDQEPTATALLYFQELCERFPNSEYVKDAKEKIKVCLNQKAAREVYIAKYYQKRKNFAAAVGRLNVVVDNFIDTTHAPEALYRLVECYVSMGLFDEAKKVYNMLIHKFGDTDWAKNASSIMSKIEIKQC